MDRTEWIRHNLHQARDSYGSPPFRARIRGMARYFIHIENGLGAQRDDVGSEFGSDALAIGEAAKMAGEILRDDIRDHVADYHLRLRVENDAGAGIGDITVALSIAPQT